MVARWSVRPPGPASTCSAACPCGAPARTTRAPSGGLFDQSIVTSANAGAIPIPTMDAAAIEVTTALARRRTRFISGLRLLEVGIEQRSKRLWVHATVGEG